MSNLYLFGDSFTADIPNNETSALNITKKVDKKDVWTYQLADMLNVKPIFISKHGTGLDWCQFQFDRRLKKINKDKDYIVISHTAPSRRWFVEKSPQCSNFLNYITPNGELNKDFLKSMSGMEEIASNGVPSIQQADIGRHYALGVARQELEFLYGESIVTYFRHYQNEGYNIINLPCTIEPEQYKIDHNNFETIGGLDSVARNEFKGSYENNVSNFTKITGGADGRVNHLTRGNHKILSEKLYNCFIENCKLDFTTDFRSNFIQERNWEEHNVLGIHYHNING
tara:strand:- start:113 stop:964 length:852 start_codon:yes stop_codon:yes gene_type:complete